MSNDTPRFGDDFYDNYGEKEDPDGDFQIHFIDDAGFGNLGMPLEAQKLCAAGLDLRMLQRVSGNELLLDQMLKDAGVEKVGNRLKIIIFVKDSPLEPEPCDEVEG